MKRFEVTVFSPYEFTPGQKITIDGGRRKGDWEVVDCDEEKVTLKCPISKKTFKFNRFCYHAKDEKEIEWPGKD